MTNQEVIKIMQLFIDNLKACDIPIYADEKEALEKLISTAKDYDTIMMY